MGMSDGLFRKSALDKLSSPEQLDVMMQVTSPTGWIALGGSALILLFVVVWSVVGEIGIRVDGQGILIRGASVLDVTSAAEGRLTDVLVKPGDTVKEGQPLARLSQPELVLKIENTKEQIRALESQTKESGARGSSLIAQYQAQARELREKLATQQRLVAKGLLTKTTLLSTKQQLASVEQQIAQSESSTSEEGNRVDNLRRDLKELEAKLAGNTEVASPYTGRVLEIAAEKGSLVAAGARLMTLEPLDAPMETVLYVPAAEGKKVRPGMAVRVSPSTVKTEEYGFMVGKVRSVSNFPVSPEGLRRTLHNDTLAQTLMGKSAPIEIVASLIPDPATPSGFQWSSSKGPPTQIFSGTLATGSVVVESRKPISYVLPLVKKSLGG